MLKFKHVKPNYNNWHKSQNKNSFLLQDLLQRPKSCRTCPKLERHVGLTPQKIRQHRWISQISYRRRTQKQTMQSTERSAWNKWSFLHKRSNILNQQRRLYSCKRRQRSYNSLCKRLLSYMSKKTKKPQIQHFNQNNKNLDRNLLRPPHRRYNRLHSPIYLPPASPRQSTYRALLSPKRQLRGRNRSYSWIQI